MFELDRHIEILLLKNSCVIVPGFGGFMAHHESSRYDEKDGTMLPPMRTVGFNPQLTLNDSLLVQSYIEAYDISYPEALRMIESEVAELRMRLERDRYFDVSSVGRLYLNDYGQYEFEPCTAGILTPSFYGLPGVEFAKVTQSNLSITPEPVVAPVVSETINTESEFGDVVIIDNEEEDTIVAEETIEKSNNEKTANVVSLPWGKLAAACILLLIAFVTPFALRSNLVHEMSISGFDTSLFSRFIPEEFLSMNEEKQQITVLPATKEIKQETATATSKAQNTTEAPVAETAVPNEIVPELQPIQIEKTDIKKNSENKENAAEIKELKKKAKADKDIAPATVATPDKKVSEKAEKKAELQAKKKAEPVNITPAKNKQKTYTIVLASCINSANAENYVKDLHSRGYIAAHTFFNGKQVRVVHGNYSSYADACQMRDNLRDLPEFSQCWVDEMP